MVVMELAAGSATSSAALGMFRYNRDGWMTDVQVNQNRRYQRQQVRLSQAEMFREDIRDLVGASVAKQNNFVLIATLVLGMIGECYIEGPLPDGAAEFVSSVYMLCVGSSLLYLVLSVICAITATTLASNCQKDLLTTLVRLPVNEFVAEIDDAAPRETVEAFEHQSFKRILRPPVWSRLVGGTPEVSDHQLEKKRAAAAAAAAASAEEERTFAYGSNTPRHANGGGDTLRRWLCPGISWNPQVDPPMRDDRSSRTSGNASSLSGTRRPSSRSDAPSSNPAEFGSLSDAQSVTTEGSGLEPGSVGPLGMAESQETKAERHLDVFHDKEKDWILMGKCAFLFGGMGASHLLQAYGYFSAGRFYSGSNWASWVVQFIVVFVNAILVQAAMPSHPIAGILGFLLNTAAPAAATLAMRVGNPPWVDPLCVPLCFSCHLIWNVVGLVVLTKLIALGEKSKSEQTKSFTDATEPAAHKSHDVDAHPRKSALPPRRFDERRQRFCLVLLGNTVIIVAWFTTLVWAVTQAVSGTGDDGKVISAKRRLLSGLDSHSHWDSDLDPELERPSASPGTVFPSAEDDLARATGIFNATDMPIEWPHPRFRPHSITCGSSQTCFAVNDFLVVEMALDGAEVKSTRTLECRLPNSALILDVTAHCPPSSTTTSTLTAMSASHQQRNSDSSCEPLLLLRASGGGTSVATCPRQGPSRVLALDALEPVSRIASMRDEAFGLLTLQRGRVLQHAATTSQATVDFAASQPSAANAAAPASQAFLSSSQPPPPPAYVSSSSSSSSSFSPSPAAKGLIASISGWRSLWPIAAAREDRIVSMDVASGDKDNVLLFSPRGLVDVVDPDSGSICQSMRWLTRPTEAVASAAIVPRTSSVLSIHHSVKSEGSFASSARMVRVDLPEDFSKCSQGSRTEGALDGPQEHPDQATRALRGRRPVAH